jgi:hypothetical protein
MMFIPHRKHTYRPPRPVTCVSSYFLLKIKQVISARDIASLCMFICHYVSRNNQFVIAVLVNLKTQMAGQIRTMHVFEALGRVVCCGSMLDF